jgi:glutamine synthetase
MADDSLDVRGMLTLEQLRERIPAKEIDTVVVGFTDHYGRLMGKRYDAEMFVDSVAAEGAHGCDYLLTTDMEMDPVRGYRFANWELGYGDFHLVPDMATLRVATWLPHSALVLCDLYDTKTHRPIAIAPRSILRKQTDAAHALGFGTFAASELEHYFFRTSYAAVARGALRDLTPAGWYLEDYHLMQGARTEDFHGAVRRHLKESGVPVENSKGEWGRGQHEVNVRYAETLTMADRHVVFKQCMKELADSMGSSVTFMAKIAPNQAGSGCHIHFSLWRDKRNAFVGDKRFGPIECSDEFRWFLGGWMARVP